MHTFTTESGEARGYLALPPSGSGPGVVVLHAWWGLTPFFMQLWLFATPVVYPAGLVPESIRFVIQLNPLTGLVEAFRACVLGQPLDPLVLGVSLVVATGLFIGGTLYFQAVERRFADVV